MVSAQGQSAPDTGAMLMTSQGYVRKGGVSVQPAGVRGIGSNAKQCATKEGLRRHVRSDLPDYDPAQEAAIGYVRWRITSALPQINLVIGFKTRRADSYPSLPDKAPETRSRTS